jgi:Kef-type K+ transport system membrane component KefB
MRRIAALGIVLLAGWVAHRGAPAGEPVSSAVPFAIGFALIAAVLAGELVERLALPRVSGYLLLGLVCGPYVGNLITAPMARELQVFNGIAVALIAFIAGLEINVARLRPRARSLVTLATAVLGVMYAVILPVIWIAWPWLPIAPDASGLVRFAMALVLTVVVISFSPTVTIAVVAENRARGPFTELVLALVIFADLVLILSFTLAMQLAGAALGAAGHEAAGLGAHLAWDIGGSFAFGAAVGGLFALYLRFVGREVTLALLGTCAILAALGQRLALEPLLAALSAGLVVENVASTSGDVLRDSVERGALPVLVVFFAAAGASLHLDARGELGLVAVGIAVLRAGAARAGVLAGVRAGRLGGLAGQAWMALVSQAGVTLGLAIVVASRYPTWGATLQTLVVALITLHEVIGPVLFRAALAKAGEIGGMDRSVDDQARELAGTP